ncbi:MAG: hypothetical protein U9Q33_08920 [Campylobacterota bacterium]|nr:hypothetical protein [Campylobacterota bacterium]
MKNVFIIITMIFFITGCSKVKQVETFSYKASDIKAYEQETQVTEVENGFFQPSVYGHKDIALVLPSLQIGKYAIEAVNTMNGYLLYAADNIKLTIYDIKYQNEENIIDVFQKLEENNHQRVILMITNENVKYLKNFIPNNKITLYLPLVNKIDIENLDIDSNLEIICAAIDYKEQIEKLAFYAKDGKLVNLNDNNTIGYYLRKKMDHIDVLYHKTVDNNNGKYDSFLKKKKLFDNSTVFLNTAIIKSSILLSQFRAHKLNIKEVLSTQLNYKRSILSLTQKHDRENMIVASSIGHIPENILQYSKLLGNDLEYNWVNYSVLVGTYYLTNNNINIFEDLKIEDGSIIYPVYLYKVGKSSFKRIKSSDF